MGQKSGRSKPSAEKAITDIRYHSFWCVPVCSAERLRVPGWHGQHSFRVGNYGQSHVNWGYPLG